MAAKREERRGPGARRESGVSSQFLELPYNSAEEKLNQGRKNFTLLSLQLTNKVETDKKHKYSKETQEIKKETENQDTKMASTRIRDCPVLFNDDVLGVPKGKKSAASPRKRKSAMKDFQTQEEYKRFAKSRNAATKR